MIFYHYSTVSDPSTKNVIVMVDGKLRHGGLADRLYGILTAYAFCKKHSIPFKLYFVSPFDLTKFLVPNNYDWNVSHISSNLRNVNVLVKIGEEYTFEKFKFTKQTHLYTNSHNLEKLNLLYNSNYTYASLFEELFKPSDILSYHLDELKFKLGKEYIGVCFRFQNLLGDFSERSYKELKLEQQKELVDLCCLVIDDLLNSYNNLLVTSDSITFLNIVRKKNGVNIIEGRVVHMDYSLNESIEVYEKSFLDFFMLGKASKVFNFYGHGLRKSGFPSFAAKILGGTFQYVDIDTFLLNLK